MNNYKNETHCLMNKARGERVQGILQQVTELVQVRNPKKRQHLKVHSGIARAAVGTEKLLFES